MAISNKCQCSKNRIVTHTPRVNMYHIPFVNIKHYSCQASSFRERELSRWSKTAFIESRFWRTNQTCDVCIPVHISYLLHSCWIASYTLNNLLASFVIMIILYSLQLTQINQGIALHTPLQNTKASDLQTPVLDLVFKRSLSTADGEVSHWICCIKLKALKLIETWLSQDTTMPHGLFKSD